MIGTVLTYMRKSRKFKQIEVSSKLNIGQTTLSGWERGFREPNFDMIIEISKLCDFEILIKDNKNGNIYSLDELKRKDIL